MKYKIGDKVKIREDMTYTPRIKKILIEKDYILIIKEIDHAYRMEEDICSWLEFYIECLAKDYKEPISITSRFDILDL